MSVHCHDKQTRWILPGRYIPIQKLYIPVYSVVTAPHHHSRLKPNFLTELSNRVSLSVGYSSTYYQQRWQDRHQPSCLLGSLPLL